MYLTIVAILKSLFFWRFLAMLWCWFGDLLGKKTWPYRSSHPHVVYNVYVMRAADIQTYRYLSILPQKVSINKFLLFPITTGRRLIRFLFNFFRIFLHLLFLCSLANGGFMVGKYFKFSFKRFSKGRIDDKWFFIFNKWPLVHAVSHTYVLLRIRVVVGNGKEILSQINKSHPTITILVINNISRIFESFRERESSR